MSQSLVERCVTAAPNSTLQHGLSISTYLLHIGFISVVDNFLTDEFQKLIIEDPDHKFRNAHIRNRPEATFQEIAILKNIDGLNFKEISKRLTVPIPTLSSFYQRRLEEFKPYIKDYISTSKPNLVIQYRERTAKFFTEEKLALSKGKISLDMVYIPPGSFLMGSTENELGRYSNESPQHFVTIAQSFFMAKYPITQAQWRVVAAMPQMERELNLDPSNFNGENLPVEQVSWHDAVEFCRRLTQATDRPYRLPTEAEWEYAARAGTTTPFHFGDSITTDLANYRGTDLEHEVKTYSGVYGSGPHGEYREETTEVGSFEVANAFGLYDIHGNVWEWCQDRWHDNYEGAPTDGSAWLAHEKEAEEMRLLRGGSWFDIPVDCRSAFRYRDVPDLIDDYVGFRVVCGVART